MKKLLLGLAVVAFSLAMIPLFAAFEAHVINVTAKIENALSVVTDSIDFGTVFPQEFLEESFNIELSQSFIEEDRVDDIEYVIRQKPKCGWTLDDGKNLLGIPTMTGHVFSGEVGQLEPGEVATQFDGYYIVCPDPGSPLRPQGSEYGLLPVLCPYLSKHERTDDGSETNNDTDLKAFHDPWTTSNGDVIWTEALGRLSKDAGDTSDTWFVDLAVPCFGDHCAQDWAEFVGGLNEAEEENADDWVQPIENEHKIFGCDLWIEVDEVSETLRG